MPALAADGATGADGDGPAGHRSIVGRRASARVRVLVFGRPGPRSSGDRAPASGAGCAGSNPAGGTKEHRAPPLPGVAPPGSNPAGGTKEHRAPPLPGVAPP